MSDLYSLSECQFKNKSEINTIILDERLSNDPCNDYDSISINHKSIDFNIIHRLLIYCTKCEFNESYYGCMIIFTIYEIEHIVLIDSDNLNLERLQVELLKDMNQLEMLKITSTFSKNMRYNMFKILPYNLKYFHIDHTNGLPNYNNMKIVINI